MVTVDTLRRYYRALVVAKWTFPNQGGPGHAPLPIETAQAILRIAQENPRVGSPGIVRRLAVIGIAVSESSVRNILRAHAVLANRNGAIDRKDRLGGLLTMYHRVAA